MNDLKRLRLICCILFACICLFAYRPAAAQSQLPETTKAEEYASVVRNESGANIRSEASLSSDVLRAVTPGSPVMVLEHRGEWVLVEDFKERKGWVSASLLTGPETVIIKVLKANVRSGPALTAGIIAKLDEGTVLSVVETRGDWLQVSDFEGSNGWLHQDVIWPAPQAAGSERQPSAAPELKPAREVVLAADTFKQAPPRTPEEEKGTVAEQVQPDAVEEIQSETVKKKAAEAPAPVQAEQPPAPPLARDEGYRLGPRDVVSVNIFAGGAKQISEDVTVSADGQITMPLLGRAQAAGLTLGELRKDSIEPLALLYFVEPQVTVAIKEYHSLSFYISGSVENPGHYELDKEPTLLELIAKAGGLESDYGHRAYIMREGPGETEADQEKTILVDMKALLDQGDMTNNIRLVTGDVIHIPRGSELNQASNAIFVEGEVKNPGVYTFQQGITALSACILAGGFNDYAAPNRARIIRRRGTEQEIIELNLDAVKKGKAKDVELQPGDLVHIPDSWL